MSDMVPETRRELLLAKVAGKDVVIPEPSTREEMYLAKLAGMDVEMPTPVSRAEMFLAAACENGGSGGSGGGDEGWFNDGDTHIWITLHEGRTSPMLGVCPKGTVSVDWGDGTAPDVLTGTSTSTVKWTPTHNYAEPGDYIITLHVDGEMGLSGSDSGNAYSNLLRYSQYGYEVNSVYRCSITKVEVGNSTSIGDYAFYHCYALKSVIIQDSVTSIGLRAFCACDNLTSVIIPDSVTSIGDYAFYQCYALKSVIIPGSVTSIGVQTFYGCRSLKSVIISDGVTSIGGSAFSSCGAMASVVIPGSVTSIGSRAFSYCTGVRYYDFTRHTHVPTLSDTNAFPNMFSDCEIRVPAALYDEWIAANNWSTYASEIVAV